MLALYACGQHRALLHVSENLLDTECLFAFQDDVYVCCGTERPEEVRTSLEREMQLHQGKTQLWNRGGVAPQGWETLTAAARELDPSAVVWKGDPSLPPCEDSGNSSRVPRVRAEPTPAGHCFSQAVAGADHFCPGSASCLAVASLLRRHQGKVPLESHPLRADGGICCEPHCFFEGMSDTDLGYGHPP